MGGTGKEFHVFSTYYKGQKQYQVLAFTSNTLSEKTIYPPFLAGEEYCNGIPIFPEGDLFEVITSLHIDEVVLAKSGLTYEQVSQLEKKVRQKEVDFKLSEVARHMLALSKPVIAVCGLDKGTGKTAVVQAILRETKDWGQRIICKHPHYLENEEIVRGVCYEEKTPLPLFWPDKIKKEFQDHWNEEAIVYQGFDQVWLRDQFQQEGDLVIWDGGENDIPFFKPNIYITVASATALSSPSLFYPGRVNLELADIVIVMSKSEEKLSLSLFEEARTINPKAIFFQGFISCESKMTVVALTDNNQDTLPPKKEFLAVLRRFKNTILN